MQFLGSVVRGLAMGTCGLAFLCADGVAIAQDNPRGDDPWLMAQSQNGRSRSNSASATRASGQRANETKSTTSKSNSSPVEITEIPDDASDSKSSTSTGVKSIKPSGKTRQPTKEELQWLADMPKDAVIIDADGTIVVPPGKSEKEIKAQFAGHEPKATEVAEDPAPRTTKSSSRPQTQAQQQSEKPQATAKRATQSTSQRAPARQYEGQTEQPTQKRSTQTSAQRAQARQYEEQARRDAEATRKQEEEQKQPKQRVGLFRRWFGRDKKEPTQEAVRKTETTQRTTAKPTEMTRSKVAANSTPATSEPRTYRTPAQKLPQEIPTQFSGANSSTDLPTAKSMIKSEGWTKVPANTKSTKPADSSWKQVPPGDGPLIMPSNGESKPGKLQIREVKETEKVQTVRDND